MIHQARKFICLLLSALLLCAWVIPAMGADNGADPLTWAEVVAWARSLEMQGRATKPLNDPHDEAALSEDGYAYVYDFGTLYFDSPELTEDAVLRGAVVLGEEVEGPRGINTLMSAEELLKAFYTENETLAGTRESALLYLSDSLPEGMWWGRVLRDGQWLETVQYTAHEQREDGLYTDGGLVCTLQDNSLVAIRVFGLDATADEAALEAEKQELLPLQNAGAYAMVPSSRVGTDNPMFGEEDLSFLGVDVRTCTPEDAEAALGEPEADDEMSDDSGARMRVMSFDGCTLVFMKDPMEETYRLTVLTIDGQNLEGPRALRVGDSLNMAMQRFRFGEGELDGLYEVLYGTVGQGSWGDADYGEDASVTLRYGLTLEDGREVMLMALFEMYTLTEINITVGR